MGEVLAFRLRHRQEPGDFLDRSPKWLPLFRFRNKPQSLDKDMSVWNENCPVPARRVEC